MRFLFSCFCIDYRFSFRYHACINGQRRCPTPTTSVASLEFKNGTFSILRNLLKASKEFSVARYCKGFAIQKVLQNTFCILQYCLVFCKRKISNRSCSLPDIIIRLCQTTYLRLQTSCHLPRNIQEVICFSLSS